MSLQTEIMINALLSEEKKTFHFDGLFKEYFNHEQVLPEVMI